MPADYLWLIPALPLLGFIINGAIALAAAKSDFGPSRKLVGVIATLLPFISFILTINAALAPAAVQQTLWTWFSAGTLTVDFGLMVDNLTALMLLFITGIGTLIHLYSIGYMGEDRGFARFMAYLNLFMFSMIILVMGDSLPLTFLGWEGVGVCSYLLVGFWHKDHENNDAARKAFITNRVGDVGILLGMFALVALMGDQASLHYRDIIAFFQDPDGVALAGSAGLVVATMLIFWGCTAKSAQIPLFTWLPDAMAGPTPVSALIHAATMVTSGIYLVARLSDVFVLAPVTLNVIAVVGALTALFAAIAALMQYDIKKVLAYSTVSQLGFMFMAVGVGAFDVALFHVFTHAFFKACMFLGSGSVIHALHHEQDMRRMGGLRTKMPITYMAFFFGWYAIIGLPLGAGFMSKDLILERLLHAGSFGTFIFCLALVGALLTAIYMTRLMALTWWGQSRVDEKHPAHEVSAVMWIPVAILGMGSILAGAVWMEPVTVLMDLVGASPGPDVEAWNLSHALAGVVGISQEYFMLTHHPDAAPITPGDIMFMAGLSTVVAVVGLLIGMRWRQGPASAEVTPLSGFAATWTWLFDTIYDYAVVKPTYALSRVMRNIGDEVVVGGVVRMVVALTSMMACGYRGFQNGRVRVSLVASTVGVVAILLYTMLEVLFI